MPDIRMRHLALAVLCAMPLLLTACAQGVSPASTGKASGKISCDSFIKAGSALAADIAQYSERPKCERKYHPGGEEYIEVYQLGAFHRGQDDAHQIWSVLMRAYGSLTGAQPGFSEETLEGDKNFRKLSDVTPMQLAGNSGPAQVSTFDIGSLGFVCVDAFTNNVNGSHTVISMCRSLDIGAKDATRQALAQSIALVDMPDVTP